LAEIEYLTVAVWVSPVTPCGYVIVTGNVASDVFRLRSIAGKTMFRTLARTFGSPLIVTTSGEIVIPVTR
jgi:hypothetical protein